MSSPAVETLALPLNRRRRGQWILFLLALALTIPVLVVIVMLLLTSTLQLVYLWAPGFIVVLLIPCIVAWCARPTRLPKADPVLDRTGISLSAGGRRLRRDVVLSWDRVKFVALGTRHVTIEPLAWADLGGDDEVERRRWAKRESRRRFSSDRALQYGLAKGLPPRAELRAIVADLSGGRAET
jgi:hypothetical protein